MPFLVLRCDFLVHLRTTVLFTGLCLITVTSGNPFRGRTKLLGIRTGRGFEVVKALILIKIRVWVKKGILVYPLLVRLGGPDTQWLIYPCCFGRRLQRKSSSIVAIVVDVCSVLKKSIFAIIVVDVCGVYMGRESGAGNVVRRTCHWHEDVNGAPAVRIASA